MVLLSDLEYPEARRDDLVEQLHNHQVPDPYRWLEDPDSEVTKSWVREQNQVTERVLATREDLRPKFRSHVEQLLDYDRFSAPFKKGRYVYYFLQRALANQPVLMRAEALDAPDNLAKVFIDPNDASTDGTTALSGETFSPRGTWCAYSLSRSGSDWAEIRVRNALTIQDSPETLEWAKFSSIAWNSDESGFYYTRYPVPESLVDNVDDKTKRGSETDQTRNQSIYYHVVGNPQSDDRLVYFDDRFPKRIFGLESTLDGAYLLVSVAEDCSPKNQLWAVDLRKHMGQEGQNFITIAGADLDAEFLYIANDDDVFYLRTNWKAENNRIVAAILHKNPDEWREVVPEQPDRVLALARAAHTSRLALIYMKDAHHSLSIHSLVLGELLHDVVLPDVGSVTKLVASREHEFLTYVFTGFLYPGTVYYVDLTLPYGDGTRVFRSMTPPGFNPQAYQTRQLFFTSKDGTRVPMFIVSSRGAPPRPNPPTLLYGYGGFSISLTPWYSARWAAWLHCLGGAVAVANLRGGNEYGVAWHDAGILERKQNVFDDFQAAARALTDPQLMGNSVTVPERVAAMGGSNGGLLVGACINQAPELFGAAIAQVGVMDMLRFHKFTIGSAWTSDFGNPDDKNDFEVLLKYSPLHNVFDPDVKGRPYPSTLLLTGDHDDRVSPLHTLKLAATLQYTAGRSRLQKDRPLLVRVDTKAGHGEGKPTAQVVAEMSDTMVFAAIALKADLGGS